MSATGSRDRGRRTPLARRGAAELTHDVLETGMFLTGGGAAARAGHAAGAGVRGAGARRPSGRARPWSAAPAACSSTSRVPVVVPVHAGRVTARRPVTLGHEGLERLAGPAPQDVDRRRDQRGRRGQEHGQRDESQPAQPPRAVEVGLQEGPESGLAVGLDRHRPPAEAEPGRPRRVLRHRTGRGRRLAPGQQQRGGTRHHQRHEDQEQDHDITVDRLLRFSG